METRSGRKKRMELEGSLGEGPSVKLEKTVENVVSNPIIEPVVQTAGNSLDNGEKSAVLENDVIFRQVGDHLGIPDLKVLRLTCKTILGKVNGHRGFLSKLKVTISDEKIEEIKGNGQSGGGLEWKSAKILIDNLSPQNYKWIPSSSLRQLEVSHCNAFENDLKELQWESVNRSAFYNFLQRSELNLESLTLDLNLLLFDIPTNALTPLVDTVKHLEFTYKFSTRKGWKDVPQLGKNIEFNIKMIQSLPWQLSSIYLRDYFVKSEASLLVALIISNSNTLEEINLSWEVFTVVIGIHDFHGVVFPRLRDLDVSIWEEHCDFLAEFLNRQPQLESLKVYVFGTINEALQQAIGRICGAKMHTLCLYDYNTWQSFPDSNSWAFLKELTGLKKFCSSGQFEMEDTSTNIESVMGILTQLPKSLQSLDIGGEGNDVGEKDDVDLPPLTTDTSIVLVSALVGFPHLTSLRLNEYSGRFFNDEALQSICSALTKLHVFEFSATFITDFGLTGVRKRPTSNSGVSLRNLKGLKELTVYSRPVRILSEEALVSAIQFLELRQMRLHDLVISDEGILEILPNNPSLEYILRRTQERQTDICNRRFLSNCQASYPRIRKIDTFTFIPY